MHKSRLAGFSIDCQSADLEAATQFWSAALGYALLPPRTTPEEAHYRQLDTGRTDVQIEVQQVEHPSRVHLDIESDDIEAEVERLEKLGAKRVAHVHAWWVMQAPSGQRFCVVGPQRADFAQNAHRWD
jgi:predicted enzyme related to lactoylglutathione lyase